MSKATRKSRYVQVIIRAVIEVDSESTTKMRKDASGHITDLMIQVCEDRGWYFGGGVEAYDIDAEGNRLP